MARKYSLYDAKARLSSIVRMVREGGTAVITVHGKPAAELRPVRPESAGYETRLERLVAEGVVTPAARARRGQLRAVARRPGALARFLADRD